jgi:hypothetical protein
MLRNNDSKMQNAVQREFFAENAAVLVQQRLLAICTKQTAQRVKTRENAKVVIIVSASHVNGENYFMFSIKQTSLLKFSAQILQEDVPRKLSRWNLFDRPFTTHIGVHVTGHIQSAWCGDDSMQSGALFEFQMAGRVSLI